MTAASFTIAEAVATIRPRLPKRRNVMNAKDTIYEEKKTATIQALKTDFPKNEVEGLPIIIFGPHKQRKYSLATGAPKRGSNYITGILDGNGKKIMEYDYEDFKNTGSPHFPTLLFIAVNERTYHSTKLHQSSLMMTGLQLRRILFQWLVYIIR